MNTKPLRSGSEIFISYVDETSLSEAERAVQLAGYGFVCNCNRCKRERNEAAVDVDLDKEAAAADTTPRPSKRAKHFA